MAATNLLDRQAEACSPDLTERSRAEASANEQRSLLERIASGCPLDECLTSVTAAVSRLEPRSRACILVADADRTRFIGIHAADVPPSFGLGLHAAPINDLAIGTCGEAVFRGEPVTCADIANDDRWSRPWQDLCLAHGIRACHSEPANGSNGRPLASLMLCFDEAREPTGWEREIARFCAHIAGIAIERDRSEATLRQREAALAAEVAAMRRLQQVGALLVQEDQVDAIYAHIIDAAAELMGSDCATMQMLDPVRGELKLLGARGFPAESLAGWAWVRSGSSSSCGTALARAERVVVSDIETCTFMAGTENLDAYRACGVRAAQSTPLYSRAGDPVGMISTHWFRPHEPDERDLRIFDLLARQAADVIERARSNAALRASEARLSTVLESVSDGFYSLDADWRYTVFNRACERYFGVSRDQVLGRVMWDIFPQGVGTEFEAHCRRAMDDGLSTIFETPSKLRPDRFVELRIAPMIGGGIAVSMSDITTRKRGEQRQRLLLDELNHRVKNTLAVVQGIAQQSFKGPGIPARAMQAFEGRLAALSAAHNVLTRQNWEAASIRQIIADATAHQSGRAQAFEIEGPDLALSPKAAVSLALAFHELGTNAVKYGALSTPGGKVEVRWRVEDGRLKLLWRESGGPSVVPPDRRGFGTRMIERALAAEFSGKVAIAFQPAGVLCTIDAPLPDGHI